MDPISAIGAAASIIQLAGTALSLSKSLYEISSAFANASEDIRSLAHDLALFSESLKMLSKMLESNKESYKEGIHGLTIRIVVDCDAICKKIEKLVKKCQKMSGLGSKLKWMMSEKKIKMLLERLRDMKINLLMILSTLQLDKQLSLMHLASESAIKSPRNKTYGEMSFEGQLGQSPEITWHPSESSLTSSTATERLPSLSQMPALEERASVVLPELVGTDRVLHPATSTESFKTCVSVMPDTTYEEISYMRGPAMSQPTHSSRAANSDWLEEIECVPRLFPSPCHQELQPQDSIRRSCSDPQLRHNITASSASSVQEPGCQGYEGPKPSDRQRCEAPRGRRMNPARKRDAEEAQLEDHDDSNRVQDLEKSKRVRKSMGTSSLSTSSLSTSSLSKPVSGYPLRTTESQLWWRAYIQWLESPENTHLPSCLKSDDVWPKNNEIYAEEWNRCMLEFCTENNLFNKAEAPGPFRNVIDILRTVAETVGFGTASIAWAGISHTLDTLIKVYRKISQKSSTIEILGAIHGLLEIASAVARWTVMENIYHGWTGMTLNVEFESKLINLCLSVLDYLESCACLSSEYFDSELPPQARPNPLRARYIAVLKAEQECRNFEITIDAEHVKTEAEDLWDISEDSDDDGTSKTDDSLEKENLLLSV